MLNIDNNHLLSFEIFKKGGSKICHGKVESEEVCSHGPGGL
nr:MAG TPA: hypothetical protein [Caudoviricetes sp.]